MQSPAIGTVNASEICSKTTATGDETRQRALTEGPDADDVEILRGTVTSAKSTPSLSENLKRSNEEKRQVCFFLT